MEAMKLCMQLNERVDKVFDATILHATISHSKNEFLFLSTRADDGEIDDYFAEFTSNFHKLKI